jgi:hypothetical protein
MKKVTILSFLLLLCLPILVSTQTKVTATVAKRIADATPKALPQLPITPKKRSDAEDQGLKGKVMSVVEEKENLPGTSRFQGRYFRSISDFDENGNRVKAVYFGDNGNPYEVSVFGYVDGSRVRSYKTIYEDSGVFTGGASTNDVPKENPTPDPRYSYKYEYRYVDGKLAEVQTFFNAGEKGMRRVFEYTGNRVEELVYGYEGGLNQKYITVLDSKGNEVEWHVIAVINLPRPDRKYRIKTDERDKKGNWTKRTFLRSTIDNGKETFLPEWIEFQTITYYPAATPARRQTKRAKR